MKSFSIAVIIYMFLGITWWGILLYTKNEQYFDKVLEGTAENSSEYAAIVKEKKLQAIMVLGEGLVLGISLLAGIWIINRSAQKQIQIANQQNNFLLSVSHELKSPIASIKLALQTLLKHPLSKIDQRDLTQNAIKDADRLEKLVQNILLTAKIDNMPIELFIEEVPFNQMITTLCDDYRDNANEVKLRLELKTDDNIKIKVDHLAIELAISNLLDNAIKYSHSRGVVSMTCRSDANNIMVEVKDRGIGIAPGEFNQIFKRFYRSDHFDVRSRKGTGLGLYISSQIIAAHRGRIDAVSNKPEKGSTFIITLPTHV